MNNLIEKLGLQEKEEVHSKIRDFIDAISENYYISYSKCFVSTLFDGIFLKANIHVNIPSGGVYRNMDIRSHEEIVFYFDKHYPKYAPAVMFNRLDFPFEYIPHLNFGISRTDIKEFNLCLYRGNIDEWFQSNGPFAYLDRVVKWFEDAVNGKLIKDDGFETIRYNGNAKGIVVADFEKIASLIDDGKLSRGFTFLDTKLSDLASNIYQVYNCEYEVNEDHIPCILLGNNNITEDEYISTSFKKIKDLKKFNSYNYIFHAVTKLRSRYYVGKNISFKNGIIILFSIKRKQQVIGSFSNYEFLGLKLKINIKDISEIDNTAIELFMPLQSLNIAMANRLSNIKSSNDKLMIIGCGAIGSKVSLNLAKMGYDNQILLDDDYFLPHNAIRNEITSPLFTGMNKAKIIANFIRQMYGKDSRVNYADENGYDYNLEEDSVIFDCTASQNFLYYECGGISIKKPIIRCEISNEGKLGITMIEGQNRNPNLIENRMSLWYEGIRDNVISSWLNNDAENTEENEMHIGFGCSSDTMVLDNSTISNHSSIIPHIYIKNYMKKEGQVIINYFDKDNLENNKIKILKVDSFKRIIINKDLKVSFSSKAWNKAKRYVEDKFENAGIWLGGYDQRLNEIIIVDTFISNESIRKTNEIICGYTDVKQMIDNVSSRTNKLLGYVGEWHTHPNGIALPSSKDLVAFEIVKENFNKKHLPLIMTIFGRDEESHTVLN